MASSLPSPPPSPIPNSAPDEDLSTRLDILLESYLTLLDNYTTFRTQISNDFSAGFLSLAHSNRNAASVLGAGRRFGQDGYDERTKASRGVRIERASRKSGQDVRKKEQAGYTVEEEDKDEEQATAEGMQEQKPEQDVTPEQSTQQDRPEPRDRANSSSQHLDNPSASDPDSGAHPTTIPGNISTLTFTTVALPNPFPNNPLTLFTALPPPPLRQTQAHFSSALTTSIPKLLTTVSQMSAVEAEIWAVRREMGILGEYDYHSGIYLQIENADGSRIEKVDDTSTYFDDRMDEDKHIRAPRGKQPSKDADSNEKGPKVQPSSSSSGSFFLPSPSRKQNLVSHTQPRSRVLKMD